MEMKRIAISALLAASFMLTACGNVHGTLKDYMPQAVQETQAPAVSDIPANFSAVGTYADSDGCEMTITEIGGKYNVEYGIYKLMYIFDAVGTYDLRAGVLTFSGTDDNSNLFSAEVRDMGEYLAVTLTESAYSEYPAGTESDFYPQS